MKKLSCLATATRYCAFANGPEHNGEGDLRGPIEHSEVLHWPPPLPLGSLGKNAVAAVRAQRRSAAHQRKKGEGKANICRAYHSL